MSDHYAAVARARGIAYKPPPPPQLPEFGVRVWDTFKELHATRHWRELGPAAITYTELDAYMRALDSPLEPWEVAALRKLDNAYLEAQS